MALELNIENWISTKVTLLVLYPLSWSVTRVSFFCRLWEVVQVSQIFQIFFGGRDFFAYDSAARIPFMGVFISTCLPLLSSLSPRPIRTSCHLISISFLTCFRCYLAFPTSFRMCINDKLHGHQPRY